MKKIFLKRIFAFLFDGFLGLLLASFIAFYYIPFLIDLELLLEIAFIGKMLNIVFFYILFMLPLLFQDILPKGSLGKRLFDLQICSESGKVNFGKRILRNIGVLIYPVDAFLALFCGKRIGEFLTKTQVIETP